MHTFFINNLRVRFQHERSKDGKHLHSTGNKIISNRTFCTIFDANGVSSVGFTECMITDNFSKIFGRKKSFTRALASFFPNKENKKLRRDIWNEYFTIFPRDKCS